MAIKKTNAPVYSTIPQEYKNKLAKVADNNHRSISGEVAHAIVLYLLSYDDDGKPIVGQRPVELPY